MTAARRISQRLRRGATPKPAARRRPTVPPTNRRTWVDARSHMPPQSAEDNVGNLWRGTSRVIDKAARRRRSAASWRRLQAQARRDFLCQGSE